MAKAPNWSTEEIERLAKEYPVHGKTESLLPLFPGRTLEGIALKANRLGLRVINNIRKARDNAWYLEQVEKTNFVPLEPYLGSTVPILHLCGECDHEWKARPQHILKPGAKCPVCSHKAKLVKVPEVDRALAEQNLVRTTEYLGSFDPLGVKHITCGHSYVTKYSYIQQGSGCPICNKGWAYYSKDNLPDKASVYLLELCVGSETFLKAGVTTRPIARRISGLKSNILKAVPNTKIVINLVDSFETSAEIALAVEHEILNSDTIKAYHTVGYKFHGSTELIDKLSINGALNILNKAKNEAI